MSTTDTKAPPTGRAVLAALAELLDRYPGGDCPAEAVPDLLDEVTKVVRRVRAALRRGRPAPAPKQQPAAKPAPEQTGAPEKTPAPVVVPEQRAEQPVTPRTVVEPQPERVAPPLDERTRPTPVPIPAPELVPASAPHRREVERGLAGRLAGWVPLLLLAVAVVLAVVLGASLADTAAASGAVLWTKKAPAGWGRPGRRRTTTGRPA